MQLNMIQQFYIDFKEQIQAFDGPILITSHKQSDPDALGSAILLYYVLQSLTTQKISIVVPTRTKQTEKILSNFPIDTVVSNHLEGSSDVNRYAVILVDTNQPSITDLQEIFHQTDSSEVFKQAKFSIILDHHLPSEADTPDATMELIVPDYSSASELLLDIVFESGVPLENQVFLTIGLLGILYDTKRLLLASATTLTKVGRILDSIGGTIEDYMFLLDNQKDYSERVANIKTAQRNKLIIVQEKYLFSLSFVSSFESSSARALQYLGSDLAAVINLGKKEIRISFRSTKNFYNETHIHCGEVAKYLADTYGGTGSGHPTAAGCNLTAKTTTNELIDVIAKYVTKLLENNSQTNINN